MAVLDRGHGACDTAIGLFPQGDNDAFVAPHPRKFDATSPASDLGGTARSRASVGPGP
ncbi:protein of unknown function (plasmid) [Cupriavidus neocaledonicus]|uniref:Uncharacterized protein n=1 Tax=Cupriavidus neocaledonicus TaxID=1040979 RepID=A0A375HZA7_9BURK|nr:protein of unknown function [Cupriavidus neocaledonicus]